MAMIALRQLLDHAAEHDYGVPAFNINNMEQIQAIMLAAEATDSPVILQASAGARGYAGEAFLKKMVEAAVEQWPDLPICLHQDHGASPAVCQQSIRSGFTSVMMDGSLREGETYGVPVEAIVQGIRSGVRKVNIDTDLRLAMSGAMRRLMATDRKEFDPRKFFKAARDAARDICRERFEAFGCAGRASRIKPLALETLARRYAAHRG